MNNIPYACPAKQEQFNLIKIPLYPVHTLLVLLLISPNRSRPCAT
jgi:hypothetical protein